MIEVTDAQIDEALQDFACTVIRASWAEQEARWIEELRAYELTVSNLRAEVARLTAACDKMSEAEMLAGNPNQCNYTELKIPDGWQLVPVCLTEDMWSAIDKIDMKAYAVGNKHGADFESIWNTALKAAPKPPATKEEA